MTWEREMERGPLALGSLRPDSSPVARNNAGCDGQPDAVAGKLGTTVQTLERHKQLAGVGHVEAHPIVPHKVGRLAFMFFDTKLDGRMRLISGELPGVLQQLCEDDSQ
jgi:hypothetical protein